LNDVTSEKGQKHGKTGQIKRKHTANDVKHLIFYYP